MTHGLTRAELAQTLNLSQQTISSYEVHRRRVSVALLRAIARALTISIEALISEKDATLSKCEAGPELPQQMKRIQRPPKAQQMGTAAVATEHIARAILVFRGHKVLLDEDLTALYDVAT
jgi:transcriptional regulator with XRE-family HTH domain